MNLDTPEWREWYASRPPEIRQLIDRFPPGTVVKHKEETLYVMGYFETEGEPGVYITPINPSDDYEGAVAAKVFAHAACLEGKCTCDD